MEFVSRRYTVITEVVSNLRYDIIWTTKWRRPVLVGPVRDRLLEIITGIADRYHILILDARVEPSEVYLELQADPTLCVAEIVNRFKGSSSHILRNEFPTLKSRIPTLWNRSYFASTYGIYSQSDINNFIATQNKNVMLENHTIALLNQRLNSLRIESCEHH